MGNFCPVCGETLNETVRPFGNLRRCCRCDVADPIGDINPQVNIILAVSDLLKLLRGDTLRFTKPHAIQVSLEELVCDRVKLDLEVKSDFRFSEVIDVDSDDD